MRVLNLYTTLGCHLCDQAAAMVAQQGASDLSLTLVEITESEALMEKYAVRIPVLKFQIGGNDKNAELAWPFTAEELKLFLAVS